MGFTVMPSPFGDALAQIGTGLGTGISKGVEGIISKREALKKQEREGTILNQVLSELPDNPSIQQIQGAFARGIKYGLSPETAKQFSSQYDPMIKSKAEIAAAKDWWAEMEGGNLKPPSQQPTEAQGVPQTEDQLPGQPVAVKDSVGNTYTPASIQKMQFSPYEPQRKYGETLQKKLDKEEEKFLDEQIEIRKEERAKIKESMKPYMDMSKIRKGISSMDQIIEMIGKDPVSFGQDFFRNIGQLLAQGKDNAAAAQVLKTPAQQKVFALLREFINTRELGGANPSTREMLTTLQTIVSELNDKESNEYIAQFMKNNVELELETAKTMNETLANNQHIRHSDFMNIVDEKMLPIRQEKDLKLSTLQRKHRAIRELKSLKPPKGHMFVMRPDGNVYPIPKKDIEAAKKAGGVVISE